MNVNINESRQKDISNTYKSRTMNLALCKMYLQIAQKKRTFEMCVISKMVCKENLENGSVYAPLCASVKSEQWKLDLDILL